ncbi:MAG: ribosomal L7Ae/L30e/S12e/Gadd45 family protein [archaeon]
MTQETISKELLEVKKVLKSKSLIIGTEKTFKELKAGKLSFVYLASNISDKVKKDIEHYTKFSDVKVMNLDIPNDELGVFCKKPFSISVMGIAKE